MIKRFLQRWLGIQELSDIIAGCKARQTDSLLNSEVLKDRMLEADDPSDMWSEPAIVKGYERPRQDS